MISPFRVGVAAHAVRRGGVVAYPTEAVWGLGCDPANALAVVRLLALKGRDPAQGFIVLAATEDHLAGLLAPLPSDAEARMRASWPGPVTWVVPAAPHVPEWLTGGRDTLAVRITAHPVAAALCRAAGGPLVSTSANRSGARPARSATEVRLQFGRRIDALLPGPRGELDRPTPIREAVSGRYLRR